MTLLIPWGCSGAKPGLGERRKRSGWDWGDEEQGKTSQTLSPLRSLRLTLNAFGTNVRAAQAPRRLRGAGGEPGACRKAA